MSEKQREAERRALEVIKSGAVTIDAEGRFWRHWRRWHNKVVKLLLPKRIGARGRDGYFRVGFGDGPVYAHRIVYLLHYGPIPEGVEVNHKNLDKGDNRSGNLELLTHQGNTEHANNTHGHLFDSANNPKAKLNAESVAEIRRLYATGTWTQAAIATAFEVSHFCINQIVRNKSWKQTPELCV